MKPSRPKDKPVHQSKTPKDDLDQSTDAAPDAPLAPGKRARLLIKLEAEFEAAERSIEEEGTIGAEEFLKQRAGYWARLARSASEKEGKAPRRQRR